MNKNRFIKQMRFHEGVKNKVYKDHLGIETIGVGRNLVDRGLSDEEVDYLLGNDITIVENELDNGLSWWRDLDEVRQRALADLAFNMGLPRLHGFVKMLDGLQRRDYHAAADELLYSKYAKQVGARSERVAQMIRTGEDSADF
jgi:lysozyme